LKGKTMAKIVKIQATACDNEMFVIASTPAGSSELFHIKSGFNNPVNYVVIPQSILAPGSYTLTVIGLNWGGPSAFTVILTQDSGPPITLSGGSGLPTGGVWSAAVPMNV
jgi:hypothetical protein